MIVLFSDELNPLYILCISIYCGIYLNAYIWYDINPARPAMPRNSWGLQPEFGDERNTGVPLKEVDMTG